MRWSKIQHKRRFIYSIRQQSMAHLFVGGVDKPSLCFAMMAAKSIFLTSLYSLVLLYILCYLFAQKQGQGSLKRVGKDGRWVARNSPLCRPRGGKMMKNIIDNSSLWPIREGSLRAALK